MPPLNDRSNTNRFWRSLGDLSDSPEFRRFLEAEFPTEAEFPLETGGGSISRRRWLQLMGASLAFASVAGCRWEKQEILPDNQRPPDRTPGVPQRFATSMDLGGSAVGLLVTSVDGRPVKIEGNPKHPYSLGATDAIAQASILELYDPDRSQNIVRRNGEEETVKTLDDFKTFLGQRTYAAREKDGAGLRILSGVSNSWVMSNQLVELQKAFPEAKWHQYEPLPAEVPYWRESMGPSLSSLDAAQVVLCLDDDLFGTRPGKLRFARDFVEGRQPESGQMNRLYVVESTFSITGAAADHRLPLKSGQIAAFATDLLGRLSGDSGDEPGDGERAAFLDALSKDLLKNKGQCVVVAGPRQPFEVHSAVAKINELLENEGEASVHPQAGIRLHDLEELVKDMNSGKVDTLFILGGNPVYNAPVDFEFATALEKVEHSVHLGLYRNETSQQCKWHLPEAHFLETWGDAVGMDLRWGIVQPMISPLYGGISGLELVAMILGDESPDGQAIVRECFASWGIDEATWRKTLSDGVCDETHALKATRNVRRFPPGEIPEDVKSFFAVGGETDSGLELVFTQDAKVYDGRFANNGWLQELPDPMTRLTWGNAALISPKTAERLGVEDQTIIEITNKGRTLEIPAMIMPGQADDSIAVSLGYGRTAAGHVGGLSHQGVEPVGANAYQIRTSDAMYVATGISVKPTGRKYPLASVQDHFAIDELGRKATRRRVNTFIQEATLDEYKHHPDFAKHAVHHPPLKSLWNDKKYDEGYQWGMTIDLSKCIGCGACVTACQAENNIPIVGKERVLEGREMHWIRVDRFFRGDPAVPRAAVQPVPCMHCETAPCEQVCPVNATVHDGEGLNVMVYNRCVGTRYCANNCPYKVRRFNYFNYHKDLENPQNEVVKMVYNPEVTVRSRGVMEKCTYCTQRIQMAKISAKNQRRRIRDGEITTACQQVCPVGAITFGDLRDQSSEVAKQAADNRNYAMLVEMNERPRTTYLAKIRNPNPELEKGGEESH